MSVQTTVALIAREVGRALVPLEEAVASPDAFATFMAGLGWDVQSLPPPIQDLLAPAGELAAAIRALDADDPPPEAIAAAIESLVALVEQIRRVAQAPDAAFDPGLVADDFKNRFAPELIEYLLVDYLRHNHGSVAFALGALGVMTARYQPPTGNRPAHVRQSFRPGAVAEVLEDPRVVLRNAYGWGTDAPDLAALFDQLDDFFMSIGTHVERQDLEPAAARALERSPAAASDRTRDALDLVFFERSRTSGVMSGGVKLVTVPGDAASKPGLALMPYFNGLLGVAMALGDDMMVTLDSDFDAQGGIGIVLRPDEPIEVVVGFAGGGAPPTAHGGARGGGGKGTPPRGPQKLAGRGGGWRMAPPIANRRSSWAARAPAGSRS